MYIGIMNSSKKLLNLLGILAIGSFSFQEAVAVDDLDDTLKQAIFLVKLLKSDFSQVLRANDVEGNFTEEEDINSTCSLPEEDFISTVPMNGTEVTASVVSSKDVVSTTPSTIPSTPAQPPLQPNRLPAVPIMMPYASWPPMPMGYPPAASAAGQRRFSDLNDRFPYRPSRRRMMPDYYYYDSPFSRGSFRRFNNEPTDDHLSDTTATSQAQTTSSPPPVTSEATTSPPPVTSEATTLHVQETSTSTTSLSTKIPQPSISNPPAIEQRIQRMTNSANQSLLATANSTNQSNLSTAQSTKKTYLKKVKEPNLPSTLKTKPRKRVQPRKPVHKHEAIARNKVISKHKKKHVKVSHLRQPGSKEKPRVHKHKAIARNKVISKHKKKHVKVSHLRQPGSKEKPRVHKRKAIARNKVISKHKKKHVKVSHLRQPGSNEKPDEVSPTYETSPTTETSNTPKANTTPIKTSSPDDVEMDEIAKALQKEIDAKQTEDTEENHTLKKSTTMKIFLQHSSRIPIPFPENNGFCHFHPESTLCGTN